MAQPLSILQKEAQSTVAFVILEKLYSENQTTSRLTLKARMSVAFHGDGSGQECHFEPFLMGAPPYDSLFTRYALTSSSSTTGDGEFKDDLVVPEHLTRREDTIVNLGTTLTKAVIESSTLRGGKKIKR